ncbi:S1 RNA-binding domain-containing protein [Dysosmobacter sp.]|uniref:S1 RNA-binding domain-containing protein n=1 Tax=Dysosmobacter sp. TaxID=2591382 RepID=UPI003A92DA37
MATKKKELLEQENTAPETTVTVENAPPPDEAQADMAAPADGGDLNELLASMDQPDEEAPTIEDDGSLPELTESEMFGEMDTDATVADALPGDDDAALTEGSDSDDGEGASAVPADDGAADVPSEPVSGAAEEPEPPKPKRATRRKKTAPAESTEPAEGVPAEAEPPAPMAPAEEDVPSDDSEAAAAEVPASLAEPLAEAAPAPTSTPRRTAAPRRSEPSILTIRSREDVETQEDREDIIWHEIHNAYRTRRILTGKLGGIEQLDNRKTVAVVDYKGFRIIIPLKEMMINLGRSPSGQEYADLMLRQNKILGNMLGADIDFVVRGIDSKTRSVVASRREAMMRKRQTFYFDLDPDGMYRVYEGRIVQARVIAVAEKVVRVEVFGVECSILARDLAWDWIGDAHERFAVGDEVLVRILSVRRNSLEDLGIRADIKSTSENTDRDNLQKCRIQGKYAGKVTDVHKGVVYVRLANGVNAVAHSCYDYRMPGKKDDVSFAVTRLDMERGVAVGIITRIIRQNL